MTTNDRFTLKARWIFPAQGPPLADGTITIEHDRIETILPPGQRTADLDLGNAAIVPGLVNCHTHLDLTGLAGKTPPSSDFVGWLRQVVQHRRSQTPEDIRQDIDTGVSQLLRFGTTLVGDISAGGHSWHALAQAPLRAVVFYELLGLTSERARQACESAFTWLDQHPASSTCQPGLSPHAPYSVRSDLFAEVFSRANLPLAIHLAETREEILLLEKHQGPFVDFLQDLGVWDSAGLSSLAQIRNLAERAKGPTLWIHGNYWQGGPPGPGQAVVYCPRTHAAFQHESPHPFFQKSPALGTDSLASNPDLNVWAEAFYLAHRFPQWNRADLLAMATLRGAQALGWSHRTGSLVPGKSADLVVFPLPNQDYLNPYDLLFEELHLPTEILFQGKWLPKSACS